MTLSPGTKLGRYQIETVIGSGGMGVVYRAKDLQLQREVAIKVLRENLAQDTNALKRLEREARAVAALSHPNILDVHDFGSHEGTAYVVTELLEGKSLKRLIQEHSLSFEEAVVIGLSIAEGLHAAHAKGVVHRDLKPDNIFITSDSRVKILDFGLAVLKPVLSSRELSAASTVSGIFDEGISGTVPYMSPEQIRGKTIDARSDIFSFGSVFYEMIAGRPPFQRETKADSIAAILQEEPAYEHELDTKLPPQAIRMLRSCLQKDPAQRIPDAHHLVSALTKCSDRFEASDLSLQKPALKRQRWKSVSLIALFLIVVVTSAYFNKSFLFRNSPKIHSLAVLPLKNVSGNPQDEYFADGITEEITSRLARISTLRVISRTSAMQYKKPDRSLKQIARELGADVLLEGSVRRMEGKIRLVTNLIEADSDRNIWSRTYLVEIRDILELQNDLALEVAQVLNATLTPNERVGLSKQESILPEAYDAYLSGLSHERKEDYLRESLLREIALFQQAVELEPNFALAHASLAQAHSVMHHFGFEPETDHSGQAKQAVDRALEIDPDLPEGRIALGYYYYWCAKDYGRALNQFGIARKVLPNDIRALEGIAYIQRRRGNCEAALNGLRKALLLSPRDLRIATEIANTLSMMRQYQEADQYYELAIKLAPDQISPYLYKIDNYYLWDGGTKRADLTFQRLPPTENNIDLYWIQHSIYLRDYAAAISRIESTEVQIFDEQNGFVPKEQLLGTAYKLSNQSERALHYYRQAREILESNLKRNPHDPRILSSLGLVYAALGDTDQAIEKGRLGVEVVPMEKNFVEGTFRGMDLAKIYVVTGRYDAAIDVLERLLAKPGFISIKLLQLDPEYERLYQLPRFRKLMERHTKN